MDNTKTLRVSFRTKDFGDEAATLTVLAKTDASFASDAELLRKELGLSAGA